MLEIDILFNLSINIAYVQTSTTENFEEKLHRKILL